MNNLAEPQKIHTTNSTMSALDVLRCSQVNFQNLELAWPPAAEHPLYRFAKHQLDEAVKALEAERG